MPPSAALSQRLVEAAHAAGGNLQKAKSGVQLILSDAAKSLGLHGSNVGSFAGVDLVDKSSLLRVFRLPDSEALAGRLGVSKEQSNTLLVTLAAYQRRAQAWKENNVQVLGWTGALAGAGSAFVLLFGLVGLVGLASPRKSQTKRATL